MAQRAELLGAIRLPNDAFKKNAGTEVVSDILFLQKRDHPIDIVPEWVNLDRTEEGHTMNSYFVAHPEMVLGDTVEESTAYGMDITVRPIEGMELSELLKEAVSHIQGTYQAVELPEADKGKEIETIPATPDVKNFSYTVVDGNVYFRENSLMRRVDLNEKAKDRVMGMVELRGIVNELIEYQLEDYPDEMITQKQAELNDAYDAFAAKNGLINNRANGQAFADDSSYYLLCSLENVDEDGNLKSKADMFTKRTIKPERRVTSVDTPSEALAISIGERGKVDLPFMAQLLGTPGEYDAIQAELRGVIFKDPMAPDAVEVGWQTADDYLSGDVRSKLRVAQMAADRDSSFHINVEALQKAQPKDLDASEIDVRLGATWIDADYIQQFMEETFETPYYLRRSIEVKFSELTAEWRINGKSSPNYNDVAAYVTYGTERANAYRILEETLNLKDIRIYDTIEDADMMLLGTYRGFELNIRFDSFKNKHQAVLRAELSYPVSLGDDARGNITRLDNAIDNFADRIADAENALQNLEQQKQAAEVEVAKPFAQEEELAEKSARLAELNALLNIDRDRSSSQDAPEESEETETPATRPSVLAALGEKTNQPEPVKPFKSYLDKEGR